MDRKETRTHRKAFQLKLRGFFVYTQQVKTNPLKYRILHLQSIITKNNSLLDICGQTRTEKDKMRLTNLHYQPRKCATSLRYFTN